MIVCVGRARAIVVNIALNYSRYKLPSQYGGGFCVGYQYGDELISFFVKKKKGLEILLNEVIFTLSPF